MLSWHASAIKRCQWPQSVGLSCRGRLVSLSKPVSPDFPFRNFDVHFSHVNALKRQRMAPQQVLRRYGSVAKPLKQVTSSIQAGNLGEESLYVSRLFAAQQYEQVVQYWNELYESSSGFSNFYVSVTAIRACRVMGDFNRGAEIAQKLLDSMLKYSKSTAATFEMHSATIVLAFTHAPTGYGKKSVLEMISRLSARNMPITIPVTVLLKEMMKNRHLHQSISAIRLLKQLADQYPELKLADFHLVDLLINLFAKNQKRATQDLLALMSEWKLEFGPNSLVLLVEAGLKGKFPSESLRDHYLPLFYDVPAESITNDMILSVAKLVRQQKFTNLLDLPIKLRRKMMIKNAEKSPKIAKIDEKIERQETSWVAHQMHYHLIAIACELGDFDAAVHSYIASLQCDTGKSQDFSTLLAFFTLSYHHEGMDFAINHILGDSIYTFTDETSEFIPIWDPETSFHPKNALLLFTKLIKQNALVAAIKVLPFIYANQDNIRSEPQHISAMVQNVLAHSELISPNLELISRNMDVIAAGNTISTELEAIIFIEVEKALIKAIYNVQSL